MRPPPAVIASASCFAAASIGLIASFIATRMICLRRYGSSEFISFTASVSPRMEMSMNAPRRATYGTCCPETSMSMSIWSEPLMTPSVVT